MLLCKAQAQKKRGIEYQKERYGSKKALLEESSATPKIFFINLQHHCIITIYNCGRKNQKSEPKIRQQQQHNFDSILTDKRLFIYAQGLKENIFSAQELIALRISKEKPFILKLFGRQYPNKKIELGHWFGIVFQQRHG